MIYTYTHINIHIYRYTDTVDPKFWDDVISCLTVSNGSCYINVVHINSSGCLNLAFLSKSYSNTDVRKNPHSIWESD